MKKSSEVAYSLRHTVCDQNHESTGLPKLQIDCRYCLASAIREQAKKALEQAYTIADMLPCETPEKVRVAATIAQAIRKLIEGVE